MLVALRRREARRGRRARVTLIRPPSVVTRFALTLNATPPIQLAYLAGSLEAAGHEVGVIDAVGEAIDALRPSFRPGLLENGLSIAEIVGRVDPSSDLLGISCLFSHEWPVVRELVAALAQRFPGIPIVLGGEHATAAPELSLREAPALAACALGEGEETILELAEAAAEKGRFDGIAGLLVRAPDGAFVRTAHRERIRDVDAIPDPSWEKTPIAAYLDGRHSFGVDRGRTIPILATRGCPYRCTFCSSPRMWTTRYAMREPRRVVDEIQRYVERLGVENVDFYDLTAIIRKRWIVEFCELLLERRLPITWQLPSGTRSEAIDGDVAKLLHRSGCRNVSYAPESGSERVLARTKKKVDLDRMLVSMRAAVESGLNVKANILVGFPEESWEDLVDTFRFVVRMARAGVHDVSVWTFAPYPGSALFDELCASGRIPRVDDDYYAALLSYSNLVAAVSWSDSLSAATLERFRIASLATFYGASWAKHPSRPLRSLVNVATRRYESRMEMSLANLGRRLVREALA